MKFKSTNHNLGFNHHRNKCTNSKFGDFFKMEDFFPSYILEDSGDFFYPMAQIFMRTIQTSSFVDMLTCSDEVHPFTALFYVASQQPWQTEVNIHSTEIPLHSTLVFPPSKIPILFKKIQEQWQQTKLSFPLVSDGETLQK